MARESARAIVCTRPVDVQVLLRGYGMHEARVADLTGNGRLDILAKPYTWQAPRLDVWLNEGVTVGSRSW